jgi:hypothetical protein
MLPSVENLAAAGLGSVDIYNFFPLLNNYVFAYLAARRENPRAMPPEAPPESAGMIHFPEAGILKVRSMNYDLYIGLNKGGVLKAFNRKEKQLLYNDCGYVGRLNNGRHITTQWIDNQRKIEIAAGQISIEGTFYQFSKPVFHPTIFMGFRAFNLTFGRFPKLGCWLKSLLVKVLIYRKKDLKIRFFRRISLETDQTFVVTDTIRNQGEKRLQWLKWMELFTTIHMGSSRYFIPNELIDCSKENTNSTEIDIDSLMKGVTLTRTINITKSVKD